MIYLKDSKKQMKGMEDSVKVFQDLLALEDRIEREKEHFYVMMLDIRSRIKMVEVVFVGTLTSSLVHPRETFRRAIVEGAASIIIAPQSSIRGGRAIRRGHESNKADV